MENNNSQEDMLVLTLDKYCGDEVSNWETVCLISWIFSCSQHTLIHD